MNNDVRRIPGLSTEREQPYFFSYFQTRAVEKPCPCGYWGDSDCRPDAKSDNSDAGQSATVGDFVANWERWRRLETCTILTTEPNGLVALIRDRMLAILRPVDYDLWLDPGVVDPARVGDCLQPFDARLMRKYPVARAEQP